MILVTKIFRFETAHAIHGYPGACKNIHGHSYCVHVTFAPVKNNDDFLPPPGFVIDFKELKQLVKRTVISFFDHRLVLSELYLQEHPFTNEPENLVTWKMEPTAENMLLFIVNLLKKEMPENVVLYKLKLYETNDSYAEWRNE